MRLQFLTLGAALLPSVWALPANLPVQLNTDGVATRQYDAPADRAQAVVDAFRVSWDGYYRHAFPHDELHPASNTFSDSRYAELISLDSNFKI
jgi:mannosyl-oligosaccharide alpha-1,2-mannosidase